MAKFGFKFLMTAAALNRRSHQHVNWNWIIFITNVLLAVAILVFYFLRTRPLM